MKAVLTQFTSDAQWLEVARIQEESYVKDLREDIDALKLKKQIANSICRVGVLLGDDSHSDDQAMIDANQNRDAIVAYILSHPFDKESAPPLNADASELSESSVKENEQNIFLHDFCLSKRVQGNGLGKEFIQQYLYLVREAGFTSISLVAVQESKHFWGAVGFAEKTIAKSLNCYGNNAVFMAMVL